jgi:hypothetical protein
MFGITSAKAGDYDRLVELNELLSEFRVPTPDITAFDIRPEKQAEKHDQLRSVRREILALDADDWTLSQKVDYLLVLSRANDLDFRYRLVRPWFRDPSFYLDLIQYLPHVDMPLPAETVADFQHRLQAVPKVLAQASKNLADEGSGALADIALFHLDHYDGVGQAEPLRSDPPPGVVGWFQDLIKRLPKHHPDLLEDAKKALQAVENYRDWLKDQLPGMTTPAWIGLEEYDWYLKHVRLMPFSAEEVGLLAQRELDRSRTFLKIEENKNRTLPELQVARSKEEYEARVRAAERHIRSFLKEQQLLDIPEEVGPMPTDAFWRAGMKRHFWEELQYRDAHNNHIHASIPGHRFDMFAAAKVKHPIRSTIRDGGRIEGWAFYIEEMLLQAGLLDAKPRAREMFYIALVARAIRIPTELKMQTGDFTLEQAIPFMIEQVPYMEENLARYDLEIYLRQPTYGMNYVIGRIQLEHLLADRAQQLGGNFELGRFHDEFLSYGLIPISMIRWEMTGIDDQARMLWKELRQ